MGRVATRLTSLDAKNKLYVNFVVVVALEVAGINMEVKRQPKTAVLSLGVENIALTTSTYSETYSKIYIWFIPYSKFPVCLGANFNAK